jgi:predicted nucleic acid-binding protein
VRRVCADTGFLIALYGERGPQHDHASAWFEQLFARPGHQLLLPWPALYEAINTRLVRDPRQLEVMERDWTLLRRNGRLDYLNDERYREDALAEVFTEIRRPR